MVNNSNEIELNKQKIEENQPKLEEKEKSKEKQILIGSGKPVGVFELYFKFANKTDIILIILAMIGSVGSGLSMPIFSLLFGSTISFIGPTNSLEEITDSINNILIYLFSFYILLILQYDKDLLYYLLFVFHHKIRNYFLHANHCIFYNFLLCL